MLKAENLSAGYGNKPVIENISFTLEKNSVISVIGKNGSGKSTLLKAMANILELTEGTVWIDQINCASLKRNELAQKISYLAQIKNVPDMTVGQLVLHGRFPYLGFPKKYGKKDTLIAENAISLMGLNDFVQRPLDTLSGGQLQNAYMAMCLAQDTDYILLDEPTAFLDTLGQLTLIKTVKKLANNGKGIIAVMHDLPLAFNFSNYIMIMDKGCIIGLDTPENLAESSIIEEVFGVNIKKNENGVYYSLLKIT